jgi:hypothetical protein
MDHLEVSSATTPMQSLKSVAAPASKPSDSVVFCLVVSFLVGLLYTIWFMGPQVLNPRNISWLTYDPVTHYVEWEFFRHDPKWHWPLTYTTHLGYPIGESGALTDFNSLMALAFKPFSSVLPEPFQYFGIEILLCCGLQFFFAWRLFRRLVGTNTLGILLASAFFLISPPLTYRIVGHYSLSNHWVLLAALLLFFQVQTVPAVSVRRFMISSLLLGALVVPINPYLAFEVLLTIAAAVLSLMWQRRLSLVKAFGFMALLGVVCGFVAYGIGFFIPGGKGYASGGYRYFSMNLLSPLDNMSFGRFLPRLPQLAEGQYEGYNYLGFGVILLALLVAFYFLSNRQKLKSLDKRWVVPLSLCCLVLTLMALSTRVSLGTHVVVDLDPHEKLTRFLAPLRSSGRLFWMPYYTIMIAVLVAPLLLLRKVQANALLAVILLVQIADTAPLRHFVYFETTKGLVARYSQPLRSPVWASLGTTHENLMVLPAWQCDPASPGGRPGYGIFGLLAAAQKMRINSYYSARYTEVGYDYHCHQAIVDLSTKPLSPDTAYVVTPELAVMIEQGPTGPGKCHHVDEFILCSAKTDFGLNPSLTTAYEPVSGALHDPGFEDGRLATWPSFQKVNASVNTSQVHSGIQSVAESDDEGSVYQDLKGLDPGAMYVVSAWVSSSPGTTATAQIALYDPSKDVSKDSTEWHVGPEWQLLTDSMVAGDSGTLRLHLFRRKGSGTVYWDDIKVYKLTSSSANLKDAILDPGFEDKDLAAWPSFLHANSTIATDRARTGSHSLVQTAGDGSVWQDIRGLEPGRTYVITAWVSSSPGSTATAQIGAWDPGTNTSTTSPELKPGSDWQLLTHSRVASESGTLRLHLFRKDGTGPIYWDDVSVNVQK